MEMIRIVCRNLGTELSVEIGTPLSELAKRLPETAYLPLAAMVNNRIKELDYKIYTPVEVRFVDITAFAGIRVYQRTAWFILQKAVGDLYPSEKLHIRHSLGQSGFYCEIEGHDTISAAEAEALKEHMHRIVAADYPIRREKLHTEEVRKRYAALGFDDKVALLDTRPRLYSDIYTMDDTVGYFYGALAPSSGYVTLFDIAPCHNGFYMALPLRTAPEQISTYPSQEKMFGVFREYQSWVELMGVPTIGAINAMALAGNAGAMIKVAEAFHERKFADVADAIARAHRERGLKMVLISGPSSSGKTTSAKRLSIQLGVLGLKPEIISLDDYFVDRVKTPLDENGDYDYEALEAIDLELFNRHLGQLIAGESVDIPRYDFISGQRTQRGKPLTLSERSILIIEGIHGLNPRLTPSIPESQKFRIYISCFTSVAMDNLSRIATTDNRLLRRMVRDYATRGNSAVDTLARWASVRRGEERHIFPYQENADAMINSSLFYEISVLRPYAEKILREVPDTVPEYDEARRMLKFLDNFIPIDPAEIPPTSLLREFIGGSSFKY